MQNRFVRLGGLTPASTTFLWQDRVPLGALTVLEGDGGSGKSTLLYDIAARLTTGRPMPAGANAGDKAGVIFLQAEDNPARTILPNLTACGGDPSRILVLNQVAGSIRPLLLPDDVPEIETAIKEIGAKLLVVDPLTDFVNFNVNDDRAVRAGLRPLIAAAERNEIAVILVRHLRKTEHRSALHRGAGSIAIAALARSVLVVGDDPQSEIANQNVLALTKSNLATAPSLVYQIKSRPTGGRVVEWLGESHLTADAVLGGLQEQGRSALVEAAQVLYSTLADGPVLARGHSRGSRGWRLRTDPSSGKKSTPSAIPKARGGGRRHVVLGAPRRRANSATLAREADRGFFATHSSRVPTVCSRRLNRRSRSSTSGLETVCHEMQRGLRRCP